MDKSFWQDRYSSEQTGWDLGDVSPPIKAYIDQLTDKNLSILVPGCGYGHEVSYLIDQGFNNVTALDIVEEPLKILREKHPKLTVLAADLFELNTHYDLILEQTIFCAISPVRRNEFIQQMSNLLNPGGKYVGLLFNREFEGGPPFGGSMLEYATYFNDAFAEYKMELCYNSVPPRQGSELFFIAKK